MGLVQPEVNTLQPDANLNEPTCQGTSNMLENDADSSVHVAETGKICIYVSQLNIILYYFDT